jgi:multidrug efflux pump subunit AcrA (membrane-fusion protein)
MKSNDLRKVVYLSIAALSVLAVIVRIAVVKAERSRTVVSFLSELEHQGVPVMVKELEPIDIPLYTKFTILGSSEQSGSGFVTADIKDKIKAGNDIYFKDKDTPCGVIISVSESIDIDSGMFLVEAEFKSPVLKAGSIEVIYANTRTLENVLALPNEALGILEESYYIWVVEDAKAKKRVVEIGPRNDHKIVIESGVQTGDVVVFRGQNRLKEGLLVNIINKDIDIK